MKLTLLQCKICDNWYKPAAHSMHCPVCGTFQVTVNGRQMTFSSLTGLPVARLIPRDYTIGKEFQE